MAKHRAMIQSDWLPLPVAVIAAPNLKEGNQLDVDVIGDTLIATVVTDAESRPTPPVQPAPRLGRPFRVR